MQDGDKWFCSVKNCEYENEGKIEEWIKFQDENVNNITFEEKKYINIKEIYDLYNAKILIYKGIKDNQ